MASNSREARPHSSSRLRQHHPVGGARPPRLSSQDKPERGEETVSQQGNVLTGAHRELPTSTLGTPAVMRSRLMLEVACELVAEEDWAERQARIQFRRQGDKDWAVC